MKPEYYAARAKAAHAAVEAATDPRDKAAWRAAAQTWERLAKPVADTYSMEPHQREIRALKRDVATAIDTPVSRTAEAATHGMREVKRRAAALSAVDEYLHSGIEF